MPAFFVNGQFAAIDESTAHIGAGFVDGDPAVARLADGGFMVVWEVSTVIRGQRYDAHGDKVGGQQTFASSAFHPSVVGLAGGGYVVSWSGHDSSLAGVEAQTFDSTGAPTSPVFEVPVDMAGSQGQPSLAALANGGFVVAWTSSSSQNGIFARMFDASGQAQSGQITVANIQSFNSVDPQVTALHDGGFVVSWSGRSGNVSNASNAQRYDGNGEPVGEVLSNQEGGGFNSITTLSNGNFVMTWSSGFPANVEGQIYTATGAAIGGQFQINPPNGISAGQATVTALDNGGFIVTWYVDTAGVNFFERGDIRAQVFDSNGVKVGEDFLVNNVTSLGQLLPVVVAFGSGDFAIAWQTYKSSTDSDVALRRFYSATSGTSAGDSVTGTADVDYIRGLDGDDTIDGGAAGDVIDGGAGDDFLDGGDGNDTLDGGIGIDHLVGGAGDDSLIIACGDHADGGSGTDSLSLSLEGSLSGATLNTAVFVGGSPTVLGGGTIQNIEAIGTLTGTGFADTFTLAAQASRLVVRGLGGGDIIEWSASPVDAFGGDGDDRFVNGPGSDIIDGEAGIDTVDYRDSGSGVFVALGTSGNSGSGSGGDQLRNIENIDGGAFGDTLTGNNDANVLRGMAGNDTLNGRGGNDLLDGGAGADTMAGGANNDVYFVDQAGDVVTEAVASGNDRIAAAASYVLAAGSEVEQIETISLGATDAIDLTGSDTNNTIFGNAGNNRLDGSAGDDTLQGFAGDDYLVGGTGFDVIYGGVGNDAYFIGSNDGDRIFESVGEGFDTVSTAVDYTLPDVAEVERLEAGTLGATIPLSLGGSNFDNLIIGNAGDNRLRGFAGNDTLHGLGGDDFLIGDEGADVMYGGAGNDTYYVNTSDDRIFEEVGEGAADRVATEVSFTLPDEAEVELLEAVNLTGTSVVELGGSRYANSLTGDAGNNVLRGYGGNDSLFGYLGNDVLIGDEGDDHMSGGAGNDVFYVDAAGDTVTEALGEGSDRVSTLVSYALAADAEVEALEASDLASVTALDLAGSNTANAIVGNNGANLIDGKGGNDVLVGLGGADVFAFTTALAANNVDRIEGFVSGQDRIALDDAVFTAVAPGALTAGAFAVGSQAADADDRIIYDPTTGALFYDPDGTGAAAQVQFATLSSAPPLTGSDFMLT